MILSNSLPLVTLATAFQTNGLEMINSVLLLMVALPQFLHVKRQQNITSIYKYRSQSGHGCLHPTTKAINSFLDIPFLFKNQH